MLDKSQSQSVTEDGAAIQAGRDIVVTNVGLSYAEVRTVALDVYKSNAIELAGIAAATANSRVEEFTESFLARLLRENPQGVSNFTDPDFLNGLFKAQNEYARSGDKDLESLLVDLLTDRSKQQRKGLLKIVLNESLETVAKLTDSQLASITLIFLLRYRIDQGISTEKKLGEFLDESIGAYLGKLSSGVADFQHLEYARCGKVETGTISLEHLFTENFRGLFSKGFELDKVSARRIDANRCQRFFCRCLNDPLRLQISALNMDVLQQMFAADSLDEHHRKQIEELYRGNPLGELEVREKCTTLRPYMKDVFHTWSNTSFNKFTLTSVGIAIAHANARRTMANVGDLAIWIN